MSDDEVVSGGCGCGAIRYAYSGDPILALNCHCRDCQYSSGSAFSSFIVIWKTGFEWVKGEPKYFLKKSDSGNPLHRGFCENCGSSVSILEPARPKLILIYAGSLDDPGEHQPTMDIFVDSAQPWDKFDSVTEKFAGMPPLPDDLGK